MRNALSAISVTCLLFGAAALGADSAGDRSDPAGPARRGPGPAPATQSAPDRADLPLPPRWDFGMVPPEEFAKAMTFLKEYSPRRAEVVRSMVEIERGRLGLRRQVYMRYRDMKLMESQDPALFEIKLKQLRVED